ncbi:MAG: TonB-dependent receptor plug domain-containing protein [Bacteroidales bacterium]|nr:TonB-dependent receptor plug domain-containing protein [Bacteroidales bacterium]
MKRPSFSILQCIALAAATLGCLMSNAYAQKTDKDSLRVLKTVVVNGNFADDRTPITNSTLQRAELAKERINTSLPYVLGQQPSLVASGENGTVGNTSLRIRGIDATRINVNINGIPLNDAESQAVYWVNIPNLAGMAQSLQVQRGIGATMGGTASAGGSISLLTLNTSSQPYAVADLMAASFNTRTYSLTAGSGLSPKGFAFDMAYSNVKSDGYVRNGFCDHQSLFMTGGYYGSRSILKATAIIGKQHTGITWDGAFAEDLDADPTYNPAGAYLDAYGNLRYYDNQSDNYNQRHYQLYLSHLLTDKTSLNATLHYTHGDGYYEEYFDDANFSDTAGYWQQLYLSDQITRKQMLNHSLTGNLSLNHTTHKLNLSVGTTVQRYDGQVFGTIVWDQAGTARGDEWHHNNSLKYDATAFARMQYYLSDKHNIYADYQMRYVDYQINGPDDDLTPISFHEQYHFINPKLGWNYTITQGSRLYMVAGMVGREPTRGDITDVLKSTTARDTVLPERLADLELGYRYSRNPNWQAAANIYAMYYKDQLVPSGRLNSVGYVIMENVDRSYRLGIELEGALHPQALPRFGAKANLTLSDNRILNYTYSYYDYYGVLQSNSLGNTHLSFSPALLAAASASYQCFKDFSVELQCKYVGEMYCDNSDRDETLQDDYMLLNLKATYKWHKMEFQLLVNNLLDNHYRLPAWMYNDYGADGSCTVYRAYYQQPGINLALRAILNM